MNTEGNYHIELGCPAYSRLDSSFDTFEDAEKEVNRILGEIDYLATNEINKDYIEVERGFYVRADTIVYIRISYYEPREYYDTAPPVTLDYFIKDEEE